MGLLLLGVETDCSVVGGAYHLDIRPSDEPEQGSAGSGEPPTGERAAGETQRGSG